MGGRSKDYAVIRIMTAAAIWMRTVQGLEEQVSSLLFWPATKSDSLWHRASSRGKGEVDRAERGRQLRLAGFPGGNLRSSAHLTCCSLPMQTHFAPRPEVLGGGERSQHRMGVSLELQSG